jgi:FMN phosphatase YigB (HAD superfamily)/DNA-binding XRE family transcriptional regulator
MDERGLGKRLQEARQAAGLTQQQLCQKANLSFSTLTKIERGAIKSPSIFTIQAIAGAVGLSLDELVGQLAASRNLKRTKSGASFIYFDVNGCLVLYYQRAFAEIARDTGAPIDVVETAYWHYNDDVCRGDISVAEFNTKLAERLGVDSIDWLAYYLKAIEPVTVMHEVVAWAAENYKIGLLTNVMPSLVSTMRRDGHLPSVNYDEIVDSSEVSAIKPDPKIYEIAQQRAGVPAEEILLIDDSRSNLIAAEKLGWNVLSFDDAQPEESAARARQALEPTND